MLPREFISRYGMPYTREVGLDGTRLTIVPINYDRYLLVIFPFGNTIIVTPVDNGTVVPPGFNVTVNEPLILTHALHGSLVNMQFDVIPPYLATSVMVCEGTMSPEISELEYRGMGDAQRTTNSNPITVNRSGQRNSIAKRRK